MISTRVGFNAFDDISILLPPAARRSDLEDIPLPLRTLNPSQNWGRVAWDDSFYQERDPRRVLEAGLRWGPADPGGALSAMRQYLAPALLLALFAGLAIASVRNSSVTGDEVAHLPAGYTYVRTGDFRLNPQHPPLIKALAGTPLLLLDLAPVDRLPGWTEADEWVFGRAFLTANRAPMERILLLARLPMVAIGVLLGAVLFLWARDLWGRGAGLFVLLLYVLCPNILGAHRSGDDGRRRVVLHGFHALRSVAVGARGSAARRGPLRHRARSRAAREVHRSGDGRAGSGAGRRGVAAGMDAHRRLRSRSTRKGPTLHQSVRHDTAPNPGLARHHRRARSDRGRARLRSPRRDRELSRRLLAHLRRRQPAVGRVPVG